MKSNDMQLTADKGGSPGLEQFHEMLPPPHPMVRRSFLRSLGLGAALLTPAAGLIAGANTTS